MIDIWVTELFYGGYECWIWRNGVKIWMVYRVNSEAEAIEKFKKYLGVEDYTNEKR